MAHEISDPRFEHDGLRNLTVKSRALTMRADLTLFVPTGVEIPADVPVAILLHGVYSSHWAWTQQGGAHCTAARLIAAGEIPPMILAMPSDGLWGDGSGYLPHPKQDFEKWIVDEVPTAVAAVVPQVTPRSPHFIAGLSMGGFGALRIGAKYADRFRAASGHSSITHLEQLTRFVEESLASYRARPEDHSVFDAIRRATTPQRPPLQLRFDCGLDDPLLPANRKLHTQLEAQGIPHIYEEFPGGHEWPYWEKHLADTLRYFGKMAAQPR